MLFRSGDGASGGGTKSGSAAEARPRPHRMAHVDGGRRAANGEAPGQKLISPGRVYWWPAPAPGRETGREIRLHSVRPVGYLIRLANAIRQRSPPHSVRWVTRGSKSGRSEPACGRRPERLRFHTTHRVQTFSNDRLRRPSTATRGTGGRPRLAAGTARVRFECAKVQLYAVDHSARASMKSAASCVN